MWRENGEHVSNAAFDKKHATNQRGGGGGHIRWKSYGLNSDFYVLAFINQNRNAPLFTWFTTLADTKYMYLAKSSSPAWARVRCLATFRRSIFTIYTRTNFIPGFPCELLIDSSTSTPGIYWCQIITFIWNIIVWVGQDTGSYRYLSQFPAPVARKIIRSSSLLCSSPNYRVKKSFDNCMRCKML